MSILSSTTKFNKEISDKTKFNVVNNNDNTWEAYAFFSASSIDYENSLVDEITYAPERTFDSGKTITFEIQEVEGEDNVYVLKSLINYNATFIKMLPTEDGQTITYTPTIKCLENETVGGISNSKISQKFSITRDGYEPSSTKYTLTVPLYAIASGRTDSYINPFIIKIGAESIQPVSLDEKTHTATYKLDYGDDVTFTCDSNLVLSFDIENATNSAYSETGNTTPYETVVPASDISIKINNLSKDKIFIMLKNATGCKLTEINDSDEEVSILPNNGLMTLPYNYKNTFTYNDLNGIIYNLTPMTTYLQDAGDVYPYQVITSYTIDSMSDYENVILEAEKLPQQLVVLSIDNTPFSRNLYVHEKKNDDNEMVSFVDTPYKTKKMGVMCPIAESYDTSFEDIYYNISYIDKGNETVKTSIGNYIEDYLTKSEVINDYNIPCSSNIINIVFKATRIQSFSIKVYIFNYTAESDTDENTCILNETVSYADSGYSYDGNDAQNGISINTMYEDTAEGGVIFNFYYKGSCLLDNEIVTRKIHYLDITYTNEIGEEITNRFSFNYELFDRDNATEMFPNKFKIADFADADFTVSITEEDENQLADSNGFMMNYGFFGISTKTSKEDDTEILIPNAKGSCIENSGNLGFFKSQDYIEINDPTVSYSPIFRITENDFVNQSFRPILLHIETSSNLKSDESKYMINDVRLTLCVLKDNYTNDSGEAQYLFNIEEDNERACSLNENGITYNYIAEDIFSGYNDVTLSDVEWYNIEGGDSSFKEGNEYGTGMVSNSGFFKIKITELENLGDINTYIKITKQEDNSAYVQIDFEALVRDRGTDLLKDIMINNECSKNSPQANELWGKYRIFLGISLFGSTKGYFFGPQFTFGKEDENKPCFTINKLQNIDYSMNNCMLSKKQEFNEGTVWCMNYSDSVFS